MGPLVIGPWGLNGRGRGWNGAPAGAAIVASAAVGGARGSRQRTAPAKEEEAGGHGVSMAGAVCGQSARALAPSPSGRTPRSKGKPPATGTAR